MPIFLLKTVMRISSLGRENSRLTTGHSFPNCCDDLNHSWITPYILIRLSRVVCQTGLPYRECGRWSKQLYVYPLLLGFEHSRGSGLNRWFTCHRIWIWSLYIFDDFNACYRVHSQKTFWFRRVARNFEQEINIPTFRSITGENLVKLNIRDWWGERMLLNLL